MEPDVSDWPSIVREFGWDGLFVAIFFVFVWRWLLPKLDDLLNCFKEFLSRMAGAQEAIAPAINRNSDRLEENTKKLDSLSQKIERNLLQAQHQSPPKPANGASS